jgi:hypothetical protein
MTVAVHGPKPIGAKPSRTHRPVTGYRHIQSARTGPLCGKYLLPTCSRTIRAISAPGSGCATRWLMSAVSGSSECRLCCITTAAQARWPAHRREPRVGAAPALPAAGREQIPVASSMIDAVDARIVPAR